MVDTGANQNEPGRDEALFEALTAPREASMVDALLVVPDEAGEATNGMASGFQAALAAKIRTVIGKRQAARAA